MSELSKRVESLSSAKRQLLEKYLKNKGIAPVGEISLNQTDNGLAGYFQNALSPNFNHDREPSVTFESSSKAPERPRELSRKESRRYQINTPPTRRLPVKFPHDVTSYLHYFLSLAVILADDRLLPWYYENYVNIFATMDAYGQLRLDYLQYEFSRSQFITSVRTPYELLGDAPDIILYLIDKINRGYYAIVQADDYCLPAKECYQKEHAVRASLIYGYHDPERRLMALGFNQEHILADITFDYDHFLEAYESGRIYFRETAPYAENHAIELLKFRDHQREYPFDLKRFLAGLDGYLSAAGDDSVVFSYGLSNDNIVYGFAVYDEVVRNLKNILDKRITVDYVVFHFLAEHKRGIFNRLRYAGSRYRIDGALREMIEGYYPIVEQFEAIRLKSLELKYVADSSGIMNLSKVIIETIEQINSAQAQERLLLEEISRQFKLLL
ncbi:MAG TPA: hypothetical protein VHY08_08460 [Bacillota bacterium]|nr:hypothetical protein [Bacillota bacterium]